MASLMTSQDADVKQFQVALCSKYADSLRLALARHSSAESSQPKMQLLRERMAIALEKLESHSPPTMDELQLMQKLLEQLDPIFQALAERARHDALVRDTQASKGFFTDMSSPRAPSCKVPTSKRQTKDLEGSAGDTSDLECSQGKRARSNLDSNSRAQHGASSVDETIAEVLANLMYVHGDGAQPHRDCIDLLMCDLKHWLARVSGALKLPSLIASVRECPGSWVVPLPLETAAASESCVIAAAGRQRRAAECEGADGAEAALLDRRRLRALFPREVAGYERLHALLSRAKDVAHDADEAAAAPDETCAVPLHEAEYDEAVATRRALADAHTDAMTLDEYEQYVERRKRSNLTGKEFAKWVQNTLGVRCLSEASGKPCQHFHILGWLARCRVIELVEGANRITHQGELKVPSERLGKSFYQRALYELGDEIMVGRDRLTTRLGSRMIDT